MYFVHSHFLIHDKVTVWACTDVINKDPKESGPNSVMYPWNKIPSDFCHDSITRN